MSFEISCVGIGDEFTGKGYRLDVVIGIIGKTCGFLRIRLMCVSVRTPAVLPDPLYHLKCLLNFHDK